MTADQAANGTASPASVVIAPPKEPKVQEKLITAKLGPHTGLFYALKAKHPASAAHSLRVALAASKWAAWQKISETERTQFEVASLLHDIGKIGVPDQVLRKPDRLNEQEKLAMKSHAQVTSEILRGSALSEEVLAIVLLAKRKFSEQKELETSYGFIFRAAAMIQILDAYDSMTHEQVFRKALPKDRALAELLANAGSQFEPELVNDFSKFLAEPRREIDQEVATRWLGKLYDASGFAEREIGELSTIRDRYTEGVFHRRMLAALPDAAIYLDTERQILHWNRVAETLTGHQAAAMLNKRWDPNLVGLADSEGNVIDEGTCPIRSTLESNRSTDGSYRLNVGGRQCDVHLHVVPVISSEREKCGAILVIRDMSTETSLHEELKSLHDLASSDPLTKVANRTELDKRLPKFLNRNLSEGTAGSLILCDLDYFKRVNDRFGHQAGDEALMTFADLLQENARVGDLVARYGGEEFIILCSGLDTSAAITRAEQIRKMVEQTPVPALNGNFMTASFGVTENSDWRHRNQPHGSSRSSSAYGQRKR